MPSRWKVLSGEFRRRPTEFVNRFRKSDRVGRRGLSEPREDFSRLHTLANQILARTFFKSVAHPFACPAAGKFSRASSAGGRRNLQLNFVNQIVSVAEDCLSPERTFHGCPLMISVAVSVADSVAVSVTCAMRAIASATLQAKHHRSSRTTAA